MSSVNPELKLGRAIKVGLGVLALTAASQAAVSPSVSSAEMMSSDNQTFMASNPNTLVLNSGDCIPFGVIEGKGPIRGSMTMSVHKFYTEVDARGTPLRDITDDLKNTTAVYDDILDGKVVDTVQGMQADYADWKVSVVNGSQSSIIRARYAQNQVDTQGYWIQRGPETWDNVGEVMNFSSDQVDGKVKVKNGCGVESEVDGFMIKKERITEGGRLRFVNNAIQWIGRNCRFRDSMTQEYSVRPQSQPDTQTEPPAKDEPDVPGSPAQIPGRRNVPAPAQVPEK